MEVDAVDEHETVTLFEKGGDEVQLVEISSHTEGSETAETILRRIQ